MERQQLDEEESSVLQNANNTSHDDDDTIAKDDDDAITSNNKTDMMIISFYYPWYNDGDWTKHDTQGSHPMLGQYGSDVVSITEKHIDWAVDRGGIDAWAVSWWAPESPSAEKFTKGMLNANNIDKIKFCMVYESLGALPVRDFANGTLALDKFTQDMEYFRDNYFSHSSYLHMNNRPVVYIYVARSWRNITSDMLQQVNDKVGKDILFIADIPFYGLNEDPHTAVSGGIMNGKPVFEAYTAYNMYEARLVQDKGESAMDYMFREGLPIFNRWSSDTVFFPHVLPKYHDFREGHPKLTGDSEGLLTQLKTFACLPRPNTTNLPKVMFVTSFNEWWEGSSIEPDSEGDYGFSFLDTVKRFKDSRLNCSQEASAGTDVEEERHERVE